MKKTNQNGITLIALIITIIVMLILVAVTINVALNGGIFDRARNASKQTQLQADREELLSAVVGAMDYSTGKVLFGKLVENLGNGWTPSGSSLPCTFTKTKTGNSFSVAEDGTITGEEAGTGGKTEEGYAKESDLTLGTGVSLIAYDNIENLNNIEANLGTNLKNAVDSKKVKAVLKEGDTIAVVPTGFTVSPLSGENTISGGLVVEDNAGNEFVWIPVPTISDMAVELDTSSGNYRGVLYNWDSDSSGTTAYSWSADSTDYREPANLNGGTYGQSYVSDSQYAFTVCGGGTWTENMYQTEFNSMVGSVAKYKGFYVGRYETGGFDTSKVVSKQGEGPEYIGGNGSNSLSNSNSNSGSRSRSTSTSSSGSAVQNNSLSNVNWYKAYKMQKEFASGSSSVASSMIWGCEWDQVMKFVNGKTDAEGNTYAVTTGNISRHTRSLAQTGSNSNDLVQNIYDLEGNVEEWTMEASFTNNRVARGGGYNGGYAASRYGYYPDYSSSRKRFAYLTLYKVVLNAERIYD